MFAAVRFGLRLLRLAPASQMTLLLQLYAPLLRHHFASSSVLLEERASAPFRRQECNDDSCATMRLTSQGIAKTVSLDTERHPGTSLERDRFRAERLSDNVLLTPTGVPNNASTDQPGSPKAFTHSCDPRGSRYRCLSLRNMRSQHPAPNSYEPHDARIRHPPRQRVHAGVLL